ncbi:hypothetical protein HRbin23_01254 [bacterium HR23]|nr:hypothetical protein HRbin23_01254 [bacterium HR23]
MKKRTGQDPDARALANLVRAFVCRLAGRATSAVSA